MSKSARVCKGKTSPSSKFVKKFDLNGGKLTVPSNPPEVTYQPWNSAVIVDSFSDSLDMTVHSLTRLLNKQLDPNGHAFKDCPDSYSSNEFRLLIKIHSVRAWALNGKMIALSVEDFLVPNKDKAAVDQLCGIVDIGNANHIPGLGYKLPASHQQAVIRDDKTAFGLQHLFSIKCDGAAICYINVSWRCDGPSTLPTFQTNIETLVRTIQMTSNNSNYQVRQIRDRMAKVNQQLDDLIASQPGIINEVLNEVPIGAAAVTVAGLTELQVELKALKLELQGIHGFEVVS